MEAGAGRAGHERRARPKGSQAEVPIVRESMQTAVRYARNRDIRRRHSLSIGACGRSCSVDKHLKVVEENRWNDV